MACIAPRPGRNGMLSFVSNRPQPWMLLEIETRNGPLQGRVLTRAYRSNRILRERLELSLCEHPTRCFQPIKAYCSRQQYLERQSGVPFRNRQSAWLVRLRRCDNANSSPPTLRDLVK